MKFNLICISVAIGLLSTSIQAAPVTNNVVGAPVDDTKAYAQKLTQDVTAAESSLARRQELIETLSGALGPVEGLAGGGDASSLLDGATGDLLKREFPIVGDLIDDVFGGTIDGVLGGARRKRDLGDTTDDVLGGAIDGALDGALRKRDLLDLKRQLNDGGDATSELIAPVSGTVDELKLDQTLGGTLGNAEKLVSNLPVDTSAVTKLAGAKRAPKPAKGEDADDETTTKATENGDAKKTKKTDNATTDADADADADAGAAADPEAEAEGEAN